MIKHIIWDFDGTLFDTYPAITRAFQQALVENPAAPRPSPGNLAVARDGALIYYDFGMMGQISERLRSRLGRMVRAAAGRDAAGLVTELQQAGVIAAGIDPGPVRRLVRAWITGAVN